jgi:phosphate transport system substrate-binding protein
MKRIITTAALACAVLGAGFAHAAEPLTWAGCGITKKSFMAEMATAYQAKYGTEIILEGGGAAKGIRRVGDKSVTIGGSCRPKLPGNPEELSTQLNPVAWDALVVIVHPDNPVENITISQVQKMYEGKITNWKELGGPDRPLELQVRKGKQSGVGRTLRELAFGDFDKDFVATTVHKSSGPLEQAVESNPNAVGVTGVSSARKRKVKLLTLEGKEASYDNIRSGEYHFYRPLYIAHNPANPRYEEVKRFIDFAHSREGREIIRKQGAVPYLDALHLIRKQREQWQRSLELMQVGQN